MTWEHESALKALRVVANSARDLAASIDRAASDLEDDRDPRSTLNERYSWVINDIENFIRNINFARLAQHTRTIK